MVEPVTILPLLSRSCHLNITTDASTWSHNVSWKELHPSQPGQAPTRVSPISDLANSSFHSSHFVREGQRRRERERRRERPRENEQQGGRGDSKRQKSLFIKMEINALKSNLLTKNGKETGAKENNVKPLKLNGQEVKMQPLSKPSYLSFEMTF